MSDPDWFARAAFGHLATVSPCRTGWDASCTCGWLINDAMHVEVAMDRASTHVAIIVTGREKYDADRALRIDPLKQARYESLGRADAAITRCPECGTQIMSDPCGTCLTVTQRQARQTTQREKANA